MKWQHLAAIALARTDYHVRVPGISTGGAQHAIKNVEPHLMTRDGMWPGSSSNVQRSCKLDMKRDDCA